MQQLSEQLRFQRHIVYKASALDIYRIGIVYDGVIRQRSDFLIYIIYGLIPFRPHHPLDAPVKAVAIPLPRRAHTAGMGSKFEYPRFDSCFLQIDPRAESRQTGSDNNDLFPQNYSPLCFAVFITAYFTQEKMSAKQQLEIR